MRSYVLNIVCRHCDRKQSIKVKTGDKPTKNSALKCKDCRGPLNWSVK